MSKKTGYVYYIACTATERLKIGFTSGRVEARLKALQTGSAAPLSIIAYHPGTQDDERELHRKFASQRLGGEWFEMSEELFKHICMVTWLAAKEAITRGAPVEDWTRVGLKMMQDHAGPLPEDLAALIREH